MPNPRYTFRPTQKQLELIHKHKWEDEAMQCCMNRLMHRLERAIAISTVTEIRDDGVGAKNEKGEYEAISFRPDDRAMSFIERERREGEKVQAATKRLLSLVLSLDPVNSIATAGEALVLLKTLQLSKIKALEAIAFLEDYCTEKTARELLWGLHELGEIRLANISNEGAVLGSEGKQYSYLYLMTRNNCIYPIA